MIGNTTSNTQYCDGVLLYIIQDGSTPLMTASIQGYSEVVQVLLNAGAHVNESNAVSSFITLCAYAQQGYAFGRISLCAYM